MEKEIFVAAVNPPSIGAVGAADVDVPCPGVNLGDSVRAVPPVDLEAGLVVQSCLVVAADNIRLRLTNASAGAIDGASKQWTFEIWRES